MGIPQKYQFTKFRIFSGSAWKRLFCIMRNAYRGYHVIQYSQVKKSQFGGQWVQVYSISESTGSGYIFSNKLEKLYSEENLTAFAF